MFNNYSPSSQKITSQTNQKLYLKIEVYDSAYPIKTTQYNRNKINYLNIIGVKNEVIQK